MDQAILITLVFALASLSLSADGSPSQTKEGAIVFEVNEYLSRLNCPNDLSSVIMHLRRENQAWPIKQNIRNILGQISSFPITRRMSKLEEAQLMLGLGKSLSIDWQDPSHELKQSRIVQMVRDQIAKWNETEIAESIGKSLHGLQLKIEIPEALKKLTASLTSTVNAFLSRGRTDLNKLRDMIKDYQRIDIKRDLISWCAPIASYVLAAKRHVSSRVNVGISDLKRYIEQPCLENTSNMGLRAVEVLSEAIILMRLLGPSQHFLEIVFPKGNEYQEQLRVTAACKMLVDNLDIIDSRCKLEFIRK